MDLGELFVAGPDPLEIDTDVNLTEPHGESDGTGLPTVHKVYDEENVKGGSESDAILI